MTQSQDRDQGRAVSPVIGVILMVAITVILAAVIGTFVLNLGGQVKSNVQAGANVKFDSSNDEVTVSYTSNQNAEYLNVSISNSSAEDKVKMNSVGDQITWGPDGNTTTGNVEPYNGFGSGSQNIDNGTVDGSDYSVVVTAVKGDTQTVIVSKSDTL